MEARTLESAPDGPLLLELNHVSSRSLRARWTAPPRPNGNLVYTLLYKSKGSKQNKAHGPEIKATLYHHHQKKKAITLGLVTPQSCGTTVKLLLLIFICGLHKLLKPEINMCTRAQSSRQQGQGWLKDAGGMGK